MKKCVLLFVFVFVSSFFINAQEVISGLQFNEAVRYDIRGNNSSESLKSSSAESDNVQLPFFDDFSRYSLYPDESLWIGNSVFVNKDFPQYATNVGAATFDAIDETGAVYERASWVPFEADVLTSKLIRLDSVFDPVTRAIGPEDSLYLSFYYQPQGYGDEPESWDTLVLDFSYLGDTVFSYVDSVRLTTQYWLSDIDDTIPPLSKLQNPPGIGCDTNLFIITFTPLTWYDSVTMPCDSVFGPDTLWQKMWHAEGMKLSEFESKYNRPFVQVMIPLYEDSTDLKFFRNGFQFRFRNYASIAPSNIPSWKSNCDFWNVDYVYLNYNRDAGDSTYRRITFSERAPSFLKDYQSMPYTHYRVGSPTNLLKPQFEMYITNLDDQEHNTSYEYVVHQLSGSFGYGYYGGVCNLPPSNLFGFQNCNSSCGAAHACPPVNSAFNYDFQRDTTSYLIRHYISDSSETDVLIDSVSFTQGFYNYFAYDDGTPEYGYGLTPAGSLLAYQFKMEMPDTLQGVQMYFNRTLDNANKAFFNIKVWKDNNGIPGQEVYSGPPVEPQWTGNLYEFYPYMFDEDIILTGTFYIGWQQQTQANLNIGFDANNNNQDKILFNTGDGWVGSNIQEGSLLIRPIVGTELVLGNSEIEQPKSVQKLKVYPNPTGNTFSVDQSETKFSPTAYLQVYNMYGAIVLSQIGIHGKINVSDLPNGLYIVKITDNLKHYSARLLVN